MVGSGLILVAQRPADGASRQGFTLIEMLVVISLMAMAAVYFANFFINRLTHEQVRVYASDLMTLNKAILSHYSEESDWPTVPGGPDDSGCDPADVESELDGFIQGLDFSRFRFNCIDSYRFIVEQDFDNEEVAEILAGYLPSADLSDDRSTVRMYIYRPRHLMRVHMDAYSVDADGEAFVPFPESCDDPQISATPQTVCSRREDWALGGYKIMIEGEVDQDDGWTVFLESRSDDASATYRRIRSCPDPGSGPVDVTFRVMTFCND